MIIQLQKRLKCRTDLQIISSYKESDEELSDSLSFRAVFMWKTLFGKGGNHKDFLLQKYFSPIAAFHCVKISRHYSCESQQMQNLDFSKALSFDTLLRLIEPNTNIHSVSSQ